MFWILCEPVHWKIRDVVFIERVEVNLWNIHLISLKIRAYDYGCDGGVTVKRTFNIKVDYSLSGNIG